MSQKIAVLHTSFVFVSVEPVINELIAELLPGASAQDSERAEPELGAPVYPLPARSFSRCSPLSESPGCSASQRNPARRTKKCPSS